MNLHLSICLASRLNSKLSKAIRLTYILAQRVDVFGNSHKDDSIIHKYWDGSQWQPPGSDVETLGVIKSSAPLSSISGAEILRYFAFGERD